DRWLNSILNAAEDSGYSYDRYWIPWSPGGSGTTERSDKSTEDKESAATVARRSQPGLLLFRSPSDKKAGLAVFLVGETPTEGIERHQFEQAACYVSKLARLKTLRILGPSFSGSVESLYEALPKREALVKANALSGVTGTVTGDRALQRLREINI